MSGRGLKVKLGGKLCDYPNTTRLMTTDNTAWSGLPIEICNRSGDCRRAFASELPQPIVCVVTRGEVVLRYRERGCNHTLRAQPGTVYLWDKDYEIAGSFAGLPEEKLSDIDDIIVELNQLKLDAWLVDESARQFRLDGYKIENDPFIVAIVQCMATELKNGCPSGRLFGESISLTLATYLRARYSSAQRQNPLPGNGISHKKARKIQEFIRENYSRDLSLDDLSALCDISPSYLCRLFKNSTGMTPYQYVLQVRIETAKKMLEANSRTIADVSLSLGFASQSHFSDVFRRHVGISPSAYRRQYHGDR